MRRARDRLPAPGEAFWRHREFRRSRTRSSPSLVGAPPGPASPTAAIPSPRCARSSPGSSARRPSASASSSATRPTCARSSSRSGSARRSCAAPTRPRCSRSPTPSRRATPTPASTPSASPPTGSASPTPPASSRRPGRVRLPAPRRRQGRRARRDPVQARPADGGGVRADDRAPADRVGDPAPHRLPRRRKIVVRHHHERWDGSGYPDGLGGEAIPLHARVFALADALDALTTDRPYRAAVGWQEAREIDPRGRGQPVRPGDRRRLRLGPGRGVRPHPRGDRVTPTILIVDDDPVIRKLITTTLATSPATGSRRRATACRRSRRRCASSPRSSSSTTTCRA